jgi:hypothetical protein
VSRAGVLAVQSGSWRSICRLLPKNSLICETLTHGWTQ